MNLSYEIPENWNIIKPEHYNKFSIMSTPEIPCEAGFAVENKNYSFDIVSLYNYGKVGIEFFDALIEQLNELEKNSNNVKDVNEFIAKNSESSESRASSIKPLYYKKGKMGGEKAFFTIMKVESNVGTSYSVQIFVYVEDFLYCISTSVQKIDEKDPLSSLTKVDYIKNIADVVIPSLKIER